MRICNVEHQFSVNVCRAKLTCRSIKVFLNVQAFIAFQAAYSMESLAFDLLTLIYVQSSLQRYELSTDVTIRRAHDER